MEDADKFTGLLQFLNSLFPTLGNPPGKIEQRVK